MKLDDIIRNNAGKDVTINIPITISIPAGGGTPTVAAPAGEELPDEPVMVPPLQAELELLKQQGGKQSRVINQIVSDDGASSDDGDVEEPDHNEDIPMNSSVKRFWDLNEDYDYLQQQFDFLAESRISRTRG